MSQILRWSVVVGFLITFFAVAPLFHSPQSLTVTPVQAQGLGLGLGEEGTCSLATVKGSYGFQRNGTTNPGGPLTAVGHITFDGQGHTEGSQTISRNGVFSVQANLMPSYTVDDDCTGTLLDTTGTVIGVLVIVHGGKEVLAMSMTPGNNVAIHFERMFDPPGNTPVGPR